MTIGVNMYMWFIYVFSAEDRDKLIEAGFHYMKSDNCDSIFVFRNDKYLNFDFGDMKYVESDILSF